MGHLIPTEVDNFGHVFVFQYLNAGGVLECVMRCNCGWSSVIGSFKESWSVIEAKVKSSKHLSEHEIESNYPIAVFTFEDYPSSSK